jgi:hypothetical protein
MRKKLFKTIMFVIVLILWGGLWKLIDYLVAMQYASVATDQINDDSTYTLLKTQGMINNIIMLIVVLGFLSLLFLIIRVWFKKPTDNK